MVYWRRNPCQLPGWMKNSYFSATAGIRTPDFPHCMTLSKNVPRSITQQAIEVIHRCKNNLVFLVNNIYIYSKYVALFLLWTFCQFVFLLWSIPGSTEEEKFFLIKIIIIVSVRVLFCTRIMWRKFWFRFWLRTKRNIFMTNSLETPNINNSPKQTLMVIIHPRRMICNRQGSDGLSDSRGSY